MNLVIILQSSTDLFGSWSSSWSDLILGRNWADTRREVTFGSWSSEDSYADCKAGEEQWQWHCQQMQAAAATKILQNKLCKLWNLGDGAAPQGVCIICVKSVSIKEACWETNAEMWQLRYLFYVKALMSIINKWRAGIVGFSILI